MRTVISNEVLNSPSFAGLEDTVKHWQTQSLGDIRADMVDPVVHTVSSQNGTEVRVQTHTLEPRTEEVNNGLWIVRFSEHQQPYQEMQHTGASVTRDVVAEHSPVLMFMNNSFRTNAHEVAAGNGGKKDILDQMAFERAQVVKQLGIKSVIATGYSLGAISAVHFGRHAANMGIEVAHVNADEPPTVFDRTAKQLQKDFLKSGGFGDQTKAMRESGIPALVALQKAYRLLPDYVRFGAASLLPHNKQMQEAMTGDIMTALARLRQESPDTTVKVGVVEGSKLVDPATAKGFADVVRYEGDAFHGHPSVNNPFVQAAMVLDGLRTRR